MRDGSKVFSRLIVLALIAFGFSFCAVAQEAAKESADGVEMQWGVKIPMRDGGRR